MGTVVPFPASRVVRERPVGKRDLAKLIGRSERWIQLACNQPEKVGADGPMPFERLPNGYLRFLPSDVRSWLSEQRKGAVA